MTQPALSRLEAGGVIPTIPLLERISAALIVQIAPHAACPPTPAPQEREPVDAYSFTDSVNKLP
jgi:transcriptional regulator with XRE-family HTH domain